ncbi:MAG: hypothetical protein ACE5JQ_17740, partial [Candidatus Methylomirabilales bacterium]
TSRFREASGQLLEGRLTPGGVGRQAAARVRPAGRPGGGGLLYWLSPSRKQLLGHIEVLDKPEVT